MAPCAQQVQHCAKHLVQIHSRWFGAPTYALQQGENLFELLATDVASVFLSHTDILGSRGDREHVLSFTRLAGRVAADLAVGADTTAMQTLRANKGLACPGVQLSGQGFVLAPEEATRLRKTSSVSLVKRYLTGRDVTQREREQYVIDTLGIGLDQLRLQFPDAFQILDVRVRPERESKRGATKDSIEYAERWWLHSKPRPKDLSAN